MDRRTRVAFALLLVVVVSITGGAALILGDDLNQPHQPVGPDSATGVIVAIDSAGLADVRGFTLRRSGGELIEFTLDELENGTAFPPGHLAEHQATAEPVRVWYRVDGDVLHATWIDDAPR